MVGPKVRPEHGITCYCYDKTQGPACAMVCRGGTLFRNYFVNGSGQAGANQIDNLADVAKLLERPNAKGDRTPTKYWKMENGYALPKHRDSMKQLSARLKADAKLPAKVVESLRYSYIS